MTSITARPFSSNASRPYAGSSRSSEAGFDAKDYDLVVLALGEARAHDPEGLLACLPFQEPFFAFLETRGQTSAGFRQLDTESVRSLFRSFARARVMELLDDVDSHEASAEIRTLACLDVECVVASAPGESSPLTATAGDSDGARFVVIMAALLEEREKGNPRLGPEFFDRRDGFGDPPLVLATMNDDTLLALLRAGADPNVGDARGTPLLILYLERDPSPETVAALLASGAKVFGNLVDHRPPFLSFNAMEDLVEFARGAAFERARPIMSEVVSHAREEMDRGSSDLEAAAILLVLTKALAELAAQGAAREFSAPPSAERYSTAYEMLALRTVHVISDLLPGDLRRTRLPRSGLTPEQIDSYCVAVAQDEPLRAFLDEDPEANQEFLLRLAEDVQHSRGAVLEEGKFTPAYVKQSFVQFEKGKVALLRAAAAALPKRNPTAADRLIDAMLKRETFAHLLSADLSAFAPCGRTPTGVGVWSPYIERYARLWTHGMQPGPDFPEDVITSVLAGLDSRRISALHCAIEIDRAGDGPLLELCRHLGSVQAELHERFGAPADAQQLAEDETKRERIAQVLNFSAPGGATPLTLATELGRKTAVEMLLKLGADLDAKDGAGRTPMMLAARKLDARLVSLFVESKADASACHEYIRGAVPLNPRMSPVDRKAGIEIIETVSVAYLRQLGAAEAPKEIITKIWADSVSLWLAAAREGKIAFEEAKGPLLNLGRLAEEGQLSHEFRYMFSEGGATPSQALDVYAAIAGLTRRPNT